MSLCSPRTHTSPGTVTTATCVSGTASSSVRPSVVSSPPARIVSSSSAENPIRSRLNPLTSRSCNSMRSISSFHPALSAIWLSASTSARRCASLRWPSTITGTSVIRNFRAASRRAWPAIIIPSPPTRIGDVHPNSTMLAPRPAPPARRSACASFGYMESVCRPATSPPVGSSCVVGLSRFLEQAQRIVQIDDLGDHRYHQGDQLLPRRSSRSDPCSAS